MLSGDGSSVPLPPDLRAFITDAVASGRFPDEDAVMRAALAAFRDSGATARERHYRAMLESAVEYAIIGLDPTGRVTEWNAGAAFLSGWTDADMVGRDCHLLFTPEDRENGVPEQEMHQAATTGRAVNERWHMHRDGSRFWGSGLMMPMRDAAGTVFGFLKIMTDETEAYHTGRALGLSEARLRAVFDTVSVGILVAEAPSGRLVDANQRVAEMFGAHWPRSAGVAEYGAWECFHPDGRRVSPEEYPLARALAGEERPTLEALRRDDADLRHWIRITGSGIRDGSGSITGAVVTIEDIDAAKRGAEQLIRSNAALTGEAVEAATVLQHSRQALAGAENRREAAEGQVRQLQKMEAVGQLTGGIAHDFNNMLAVVVGGLGLAQRRLARGDTAIDRFVDAAMDGAQRAAVLTQRLLAFSRQQPLAPVSLDMNGMVRGMEELLRRTLGEAIELEMVLAGGLWRTHADPSQLENALLNLAVNARDAMDGIGCLTVETGNAHLDEAYARAHDEVMPGQYALLAVSDIGTGMPPEVIARAFEPFFTTKAPGAGTGLGLAQVYGFVKQSAGHLKIYSEPGQGTTVKLYLPRFLGQPEAIQPPVPRDTLPQGRADEVVLVVEDEERVRDLAVLGLRELGYGVVEARNAGEALRRLDAHPEVALLFTDIVMPGTNGRVLADEARRRRPGLKVLFTTGYTRNAVVHNGVLDAGVDLLGKPYGIGQLAAKLRDVLDRPDI